MATDLADVRRTFVAARDQARTVAAAFDDLLSLLDEWEGGQVGDAGIKLFKERLTFAAESVQNMIHSLPSLTTE
jgi:hypothetical protein